MTSTLMVLVLLSQAEQPAPSSVGAVPPFAASTVGGWRYLTAHHPCSVQVRWRFSRALYALTEGGTLLCPRADGALRPDTYASLDLGVDHAR